MGVCKDSIRMYIKETLCEFVDRIRAKQDRMKFRAVLKRVMNNQTHKRLGTSRSAMGL